MTISESIRHKTLPKTAVLAACLAGAALLPSSLEAVIVFDENVTSDAIYGSGNANGGFTVDRANGVELGLRAHVRYDVVDDQPKNVYNSNGDGTYSHAAGAPAANPNRARWNFDWSINTDYQGTSGLKLSDLTYTIGLDYDPGLGVNFQTFDPINTFWADNSFGDNSTGNGAGVEAPFFDFVAYGDLVANNNLGQNSWNLAFFANPIAYPFDPTVPGTYDFYLEAYDQAGAQLARTDIRVLVGGGASSVPDVSSTLSLFALGCGALGLFGWRRMKPARA